MKKSSTCVILLCALFLVISIEACKSESKSENNKVLEDFELLTEDITVTVDEAIDAMEKACKSGDKEAALSAYEIILRDALDETIKRVKAGDYSEETVFTEEQEKRLEDISNDCDCISDEDIQEITDKVESEY